MPWTIDIDPLAGGSPVVTAAPFRSARVSWAADGFGSLEITLRPSDVATGTWLYGRRRLSVRNGAGTRVYQGWMDRLEREGSPGDIRYRAVSRGLAAILDDRVAYGDLFFINTVTTSIAVGLLTHLNSQTDDKTGFVLGTIVGGPARTVSRYYCYGDVISEIFKELAETQDGGFAWEIDENGLFNAWVGEGVPTSPPPCLSRRVTYMTGNASVVRKTL